MLCGTCTAESCSVCVWCREFFWGFLSISEFEKLFKGPEKYCSVLNRKERSSWFWVVRSDHLMLKGWAHPSSSVASSLSNWCLSRSMWSFLRLESGDGSGAQDMDFNGGGQCCFIELIRETRTQTQPSGVSSICQKKNWYLLLKGLPPEFWNPMQFLCDDLQSCSLSLKV